MGSSANFGSSPSELVEAVVGMLLSLLVRRFRFAKGKKVNPLPMRSSWVRLVNADIPEGKSLMRLRESCNVCKLVKVVTSIGSSDNALPTRSKYTRCGRGDPSNGGM